MAFREVRRKDRQVFDELIDEILQEGEYGVLSVVGENGYPYGVPVNYAYMDGAIYFHCAKSGHKLDAIRENDKISFSIVSDTELIPEEFSTKYKSVIAFGRASEISGQEKNKALMKLIEKYSPGFIEQGRRDVENGCEGALIIKISIEHITGKARI